MRKRANGSLDLRFLVGHVLADDGIVLADLHLGGRGLLVLVGGVEMTGAGGRDEADLVALGCHGGFSLDLLCQTRSPRARSWAITESIPFLSIVRRAWAETRSLIQRFSLATQKRRSCRFGMNRRRV